MGSSTASSSFSDIENDNGFIKERRSLLHQSSSDSTDSDEEILQQIADRTRNLRTFCERVDNFNKWNEEEFFVRFRLTKNSVALLLDRIGGQLASATRRNHAVPPMNQLLLALRFYATGSMLVSVGDFSGVHKSTACQIIKKVSNAIAGLAPEHLRMPNNEEEIRAKQMAFYNIARFPRVVGAIDCTHIKIQSPGGENAEYFRNRKGYFSLNVQVFGDATLHILDLVARWPGSTHDQTIFNNSYIHARFEANEFNDCLIMGDSGYALTRYLITPMGQPATQGEQLFNEAQIRSRNPIERLFGVWKRRFPILSLGIRLSLNTAKAVIIACAVLHNIATDRSEEIPPDDQEVVVEEEEEEDDDLPQQPNIVAGGNWNFREPLIAYFTDLEAIE